MPWGLPDPAVARMRAVLAQYPAVEQAILYGSRAKNTYREGSDIDLTLVGDALTWRDLGSIDDALDDLLLPYRIDLSLIRQITQDDLLDHIARVGVIFYQRSQG